MNADRIEVGRSEVVVYCGDEAVQTFDRATVIMMDESTVDGSRVSPQANGSSAEKPKKLQTC
jgi:hypothetical protein